MKNNLKKVVNKFFHNKYNAVYLFQQKGNNKMKAKLIKQAIELYKKTLDKKSKWYNDDLANFSSHIKTASLDKINQSINNMSYAQSKKADADFNRETRKLEKAGMFNIGNMKVINALD